MRELVTVQHMSLDGLGRPGHVVDLDDDPLSVGEWVSLDGTPCRAAAVQWPTHRG
jgi:hypothetical protein